MVKGKWQKILLWAAGTAYVLLLLITLGHTQPPLFDEVGFVQNVVLFRDMGFTREFLLTMPDQAPGPLYQFVHYPLWPLTGLEAPGIRLVNIVLLAGIILLMAATLKRMLQYPYSEALSWAAALVVVPMVWQVSGLALSEVPAMFFATASVFTVRQAVAYENDRPGKSIALACLSGILLGLTILGRSPFLLLAFAGGAMLLGNFGNIKRWRTVLLYGGIGLGLALPVFLIWGGLVPPDQKAVNTGGLSLWHGILAFAYAALFTLIVAPKWFYISRKLLVYMGLFYIAFFALNYMVLDYKYYPLSEVLKKVAPQGFMNIYPYLISPLLATMAVYFVGCCAVRAWEHRGNPFFLFLLAGGMALLASSFSVTHLFSTRYVAQAAPFLVMVMAGYDKPGRARLLRFAIGVFIGVLSLETYFKFQ